MSWVSGRLTDYETRGIKCACCGKDIGSDQKVYHDGYFNVSDNESGLVMKIVSSNICKDCAKKDTHAIVLCILKRICNDK